MLFRSLLLSSTENYFQNAISSASLVDAKYQVNLSDFIDPTTFRNLLNFINKGELTLSTENLHAVLNTAKVLSMDSLKEVCF